MDSNLLAKVYGDIIDFTDTLNSSRSLRKYLIQALYEFTKGEKLEDKKEISLEQLNLALFNHLRLDIFERHRIVNKKYSEQAVDVHANFAFYDVNSAAPLGHLVHNWTLLSRLEEEVTQDMIVAKLNISPTVKKENNKVSSDEASALLSDESSEVELSEIKKAKVGR